MFACSFDNLLFGFLCWWPFFKISMFCSSVFFWNLINRPIHPLIHLLDFERSNAVELTGRAMGYAIFTFSSNSNLLKRENRQNKTQKYLSSGGRTPTFCVTSVRTLWIQGKWSDFLLNTLSWWSRNKLGHTNQAEFSKPSEAFVCQISKSLVL